MATTIIEQHTVSYSANTFAPHIGLKSGGEFIGQLFFRPTGSQLPPDQASDGQVTLYYHLEDFANVIDLIRTENPIFLVINGSGGGFENGITSTP